MSSQLSPDFRHVFRLRDGEVILVAHRDARRTIDRRSDRAPIETVWEVTMPSGLVRRLWPEEIASWDQELM